MQTIPQEDKSQLCCYFSNTCNIHTCTGTRVNTAFRLHVHQDLYKLSETAHLKKLHQTTLLDSNIENAASLDTLQKIIKIAVAG